MFFHPQKPALASSLLPSFLSASALLAALFWFDTFSYKRFGSLLLLRPPLRATSAMMGNASQNHLFSTKLQAWPLKLRLFFYSSFILARLLAVDYYYGLGGTLDYKRRWITAHARQDGRGVPHEAFMPCRLVCTITILCTFILSS